MVYEIKDPKFYYHVGEFLLGTPETSSSSWQDQELLGWIISYSVSVPGSPIFNFLVLFSVPYWLIHGTGFSSLAHSTAFTPVHTADTQANIVDCLKIMINIWGLAHYSNFKSKDPLWKTWRRKL